METIGGLHCNLAFGVSGQALQLSELGLGLWVYSFGFGVYGLGFRV